MKNNIYICIVVKELKHGTVLVPLIYKIVNVAFFLLKLFIRCFSINPISFAGRVFVFKKIIHKRFVFNINNDIFVNKIRTCNVLHKR